MTTIKRQALILFAHGARDPRWAEPLIRVRQLVGQRVDPSVQTHIAYLELMSPSLRELVDKLVSEQINSMTIIPIFLGQGGHVRHDLPELISQLKSEHAGVEFHLVEAIGENEQVLSSIAGVCVASLK